MRRLLYAFLLAAVVAIVPMAARVEAEPAATLGVYEGPADAQGVRDFGTWLGREPDVIVDFVDHRAGWSAIENPSWLLDGYASLPDRRLVLSLPPFPTGEGASYGACASGSYNAHFVNLANLAVSKGRDDTVWRIAWEFNGTWMPWSAPTQSVEYAACFRQIVTAMRSVPGQAFQFDWCPNEGVPVDPASYPGDAYVDYVGSDAYAPGPRSGPTFDQMVADPDWGLQVQKDFAAAHGKKVSFPEWGLWNEDDPAYIDGMADWFESLGSMLGYQSYFNVAECSGCAANHQLSRPEFDASEAAYRARFSVAPASPD